MLGSQGRTATFIEYLLCAKSWDFTHKTNPCLFSAGQLVELPPQIIDGKKKWCLKKWIFFLDITGQIRASLELSSAWLYPDPFFSYLMQNWTGKITLDFSQWPLGNRLREWDPCRLHVLPAFHGFSMESVLLWGEFQVSLWPDRSQTSTYWAWSSKKEPRLAGAGLVITTARCVRAGRCKAK